MLLSNESFVECICWIRCQCKTYYVILFFRLAISEGRRSQGDTTMATAAQFAAGGSSSPSTPAPATTPPTQPQPTQLIVLPASLHQVIHPILPYQIAQSPLILIVHLTTCVLVFHIDFILNRSYISFISF